MEKENENQVEVKEQSESGVLTVNKLGALGGLIIAILGTVAGGFVFIDDNYVSKEVYDIYVERTALDLQQLENKTAQLLEAVQTTNQQEFNRVYKAIKDGTALPLIVRRDILLARGDGLTPEERAELSILETKLDELNISN
jgi:hypothetical protein